MMYESSAVEPAAGGGELQGDLPFSDLPPSHRLHLICFHRQIYLKICSFFLFLIWCNTTTPLRFRTSPVLFVFYPQYKTSLDRLRSEALKFTTNIVPLPKMN